MHPLDTPTPTAEPEPGHAPRPARASTLALALATAPTAVPLPPLAPAPTDPAARTAIPSPHPSSPRRPNHLGTCMPFLHMSDGTSVRLDLLPDEVLFAGIDAHDAPFQPAHSQTTVRRDAHAVVITRRNEHQLLAHAQAEVETEMINDVLDGVSSHLLCDDEDFLSEDIQLHAVTAAGAALPSVSA